MNVDVTHHALSPNRLLCATWSSFPVESGLEALPQTARAAEAIASVLGRAQILSDVPIILSDASGVACLSAVEDLVSRAQDAGEGLVIYLASHGLPPTTSQQLYRLATGETRRSDDLLGSIPLDEVMKIMKRSNAPMNLLIVDACYSARAGETLIGIAPKAIQASNLDNLCILASSGPYSPSVALPDQQLTAFAGLLVNALTNGDSGGADYLTVSSLYTSVKAAAVGRGYPSPFLFAQGLTAEARLLPNPKRNGAAAPVRQVDSTNPVEDRAEILYVDDDVKMLAIFKNELERAGHAVTIVETPDAARQYVERKYYDIIVVDLFLFGDLPASELIAYLSKAAQESTIIVVSRESKGRQPESWTTLSGVFHYPHRVSAFVFKSSYLRTVTMIANQISKQRKLVLSHIHGLGQWAPLVSGRLVRRRRIADELSSAAEVQARICVERLVARWFGKRSDATDYIHSMEMEPVDSGRSACSVFTLTPRMRGIVPTTVNPLILKIGPRADIREEVERYEKFVQIGVPLELRTDKIAFAEVADVGAVLYSFLGEASGTIHEVGQLGTAEIADCIASIFDPSRKRWYASVGVGDGIRLLEYFETRKYNAEKFNSVALVMSESLAKLNISAGRIDQYFSENPHVLGDTQVATLVHGDLHLGNILKYGDGRYAMIDYQTVGVGPRLMDFISLEIACWLRAAAPEQMRSNLMTEAVHAVGGGGLWHSLEPHEVAPWLRDSMALARHCRALACSNFPDMTATEYGSLLWLGAVRRSELREAATAQERRTLKVVPTALALAAQKLVES